MALLASAPAVAQVCAGSVEEAVLQLANFGSADQLNQAIRLGWSDTNFTDYLVQNEVQSLLVHRNGPDQVSGTADDNPFDNLIEVYNTTTLGPESMEGLERYVKLYMPVPAGSPTLRFVNKKSTSANLLTKKVGVDAKTSTNIWRTRKAGPNHKLGDADDKWMDYQLIFGETFLYGNAGAAHVHSLDEVPGVGPTSIQKIADYAVLKGF
jgi:hypothetical protein